LRCSRWFQRAEAQSPSAGNTMTIKRLCARRRVRLRGSSACRIVIAVRHGLERTGVLDRDTNEKFSGSPTHRAKCGEKVRVIQLDDGSMRPASTRNARKWSSRRKSTSHRHVGRPQDARDGNSEMKVTMIAVSPIAPVPPGEGGPGSCRTPAGCAAAGSRHRRSHEKRGRKTVAFIVPDAFGERSKIACPKRGGAEHQGGR